MTNNKTVELGDNKKKLSPSKEQFKNWIIGISILMIFVYSFYYVIFRTTNEIGWLGADKNGRQILIQTLDKSSKEVGINVDSDFYSHPIWERMIIGEPMRTVIRYDVKNPNEVNRFAIQDHLSQPYTSFTDNISGEISIRSDSSISKEYIIERLNENGARTMEDLYAGFGFKRIELYSNGKFTSAQEIRGVKNVFNSGGD